MGYKKIDNLYKNQTILMFKECYAMEKIHGTSANISYCSQIEKINYFAGGSSQMLFIGLFDNDKLIKTFKEMLVDKITIYGESFGGKCQGMSASYGKEQSFVAFEVKIGDTWLSVPNAEDMCNKLEIPFMPYKRIPCTLTAIDVERDRDSIIGKQKTGKDGIIREGVVLRPIQEFSFQNNRGGVIRAKHKRDEFMEMRTKRKVSDDPEKMIVLNKADEIALEWVTEMRLKHVLDKLPDVHDMRSTQIVMEAMIEDVLIESTDEIVDSKEARRAIGTRTAKLLKQYFINKLKEMSV